MSAWRLRPSLPPRMHLRDPSMFNKEASFYNALRKPPSDDTVFIGMSRRPSRASSIRDT